MQGVHMLYATSVTGSTKTSEEWLPATLTRALAINTINRHYHGEVTPYHGSASKSIFLSKYNYICSYG
jgi:hypothetical protein